MNNFSTEEVLKILNQLIGQVAPIGETTRDEIYFSNLQTMCEISEYLIDRIRGINGNYKDSYEYSVKRAGEYAGHYLENLKRDLE